jgi:nucleoside 2-deoxyribosyltransferase
MKIYLATPVNGRKEKTREEKQKAAEKRINEMADFLVKLYPEAEFMSSFNIIGVKYHLNDLSEAVIMGACVRMVMESDLVVMDENWRDSRGCWVEQMVAQQYGIRIESYARLRLKEKIKE